MLWWRERVRKNSISHCFCLGKEKPGHVHSMNKVTEAVFYTPSVIPLLFSPSSNWSPLNIILFHSFLHLLFSKTHTCPQSTYAIILQLCSLSTFYPANSSFIQHPACLPACLIFLVFMSFFFFYRKQINPYIDIEISKLRNLLGFGVGFGFFFNFLILFK